MEKEIKILVLWKDGSYRVYNNHLDAKYSENDPDWLLTLNLNKI